jgi:hypothetical protein
VPWRGSRGTRTRRCPETHDEAEHRVGPRPNAALVEPAVAAGCRRELVQVPLVLAAARVVARRLAGCISQLLGGVVLPRCRNEEEDRGGMWRVGDGEEGRKPWPGNLEMTLGSCGQRLGLAGHG